MAGANRPPKEQPPKEPAEGSRRTVEEALARTSRADRRAARPPRRRDKAQEDVPPGRQALDD